MTKYCLSVDPGLNAGAVLFAYGEGGPKHLLEAWSWRGQKKNDSYVLNCRDISDDFKKATRFEGSHFRELVIQLARHISQYVYCSPLLIQIEEPFIDPRKTFTPMKVIECASLFHGFLGGLYKDTKIIRLHSATWRNIYPSSIKEKWTEILPPKPGGKRKRKKVNWDKIAAEVAPMIFPEFKGFEKKTNTMEAAIQGWAAIRAE